ncbi:hypothetical protein AtEden1_Chr1g0035221 [Arabidopsis thaliana]
MSCQGGGEEDTKRQREARQLSRLTSSSAYPSEASRQPVRLNRSVSSSLSVRRSQAARQLTRPKYLASRAVSSSLSVRRSQAARQLTRPKYLASRSVSSRLSVRRSQAARQLTRQKYLASRSVSSSLSVRRSQAARQLTRQKYLASRSVSSSLSVRRSQAARQLTRPKYLASRKTTTSILGRASHSTSSSDIAACSPTRKGLQGTIDPIILGDDTSSPAIRTITLTNEEVPSIKEEHSITSLNIPTSLSLAPNQDQEEKSSGERHLENLDDDTPSSAARTITSAHEKTIQIKNTTRRHLLYRPRYRPRLNT